MLVVPGVVRVGAQDAQPGARDGGQRVVLAQLVLAVPEEGEVVVGEPAQQLAGLLHVLVAQVVGGVLGGQPVGDPDRRVPHLLPVLDGLADVGQNTEQIVVDLLEVRPVGLAVHLDVDPGFDVRVMRQRLTGCHGGGRRGDGGRFDDQLDELAGDVPSYDDLRMDDDVDAAPLP